MHAVRLTMVIAAMVCAVPWGAALHAAVLMGSVNTNPGTGVVDLTQQGDVDWAIWNYTTTSNTTSAVAATNRRNGGTANISSISMVGTATGLRGSSGTSIGAKLFSYSNGVSPVSLAPSQQSLVFANPLDSQGAGVQLSLTGDPGQLYTVNIWATGFSGQGTMTAALSGAADVALLSQTYLGISPKEPTLFTFQFSPDSAADLLTITYIMTADTTTSSNSHVGIQAITVSAIPEPSKALLCLLGVVGITLLRRRRHSGFFLSGGVAARLRSS